MKKPETIFKEKVLSDIKKIPNIFVEKIQQVSIIGTPDIFLCLCGFFFALELKKDSSAKISKMQIYKLQKIYNAEGIALIVSPENWSEIYGKIAEISSSKRRKKASYDYLRALSKQNVFSDDG